MTDREKLLELAKDVETSALDAGRLAEHVASYAETGMFDAATARIDRAVEHAQSLLIKLRALKQFMKQHSDLNAPDW